MQSENRKSFNLFLSPSTSNSFTKLFPNKDRHVYRAVPIFTKPLFYFSSKFFYVISYFLSIPMFFRFKELYINYITTFYFSLNKMQDFEITGSFFFWFISLVYLPIILTDKKGTWWRWLDYSDSDTNTNKGGIDKGYFQRKKISNHLYFYKFILHVTVTRTCHI